MRSESPIINKLWMTFRTLPSTAASLEAKLPKPIGHLGLVEVPSLLFGPREVGAHDWIVHGIGIDQKEAVRIQ